MIDLGMNVARLNFSHGSHEVSNRDAAALAPPFPSSTASSFAQLHAQSVANIRQAVAERPGSHVAIMLDTKGPEIRTGFLVDHKPVHLTRGQLLEITTDYTVRRLF